MRTKGQRLLDVLAELLPWREEESAMGYAARVRATGLLTDDEEMDVMAELTWRQDFGA